VGAFVGFYFVCFSDSLSSSVSISLESFSEFMCQFGFMDQVKLHKSSGKVYIVEVHL
jgi:hypothetical protein